MIKFIMHGGCGGYSDGEFEAMQKRIEEIASRASFEKADAVSAAVSLVRALEDDPMFNAGTGSKIQRDGKIRMTASIMDSEQLKFASVLNVQNVKNPVNIARELLREEYSVLVADQGDFVRNMNLPFHNPLTERRFKEFRAKKKGDTGTVGAVAIDGRGVICAATSTGGIGFEMPGRVSDVSSPAGTYVSGMVGVSATGQGEKITDASAASSIVSLRENGFSVKDSIDCVFRKLEKIQGRCGVIGIDREEGIFHREHMGRMVFASREG